MRISVGVDGLDEILHGGLVPRRSYLIHGGPGSGKTTLGLHFLTAEDAGPSLFISLSEPADQLRADARSCGFDTSAIEFLDLSPSEDFFSRAEAYDIFSPAEVEREPTTHRLAEAVAKLKPRRIFIDSLTQFRYLAPDGLQFRKQTLSLLRFLVQQEATVMASSESTPENPDDDLRFMTDGVIELDLTPAGRTIAVTKFRGSDFVEGRHTVRLSAWGMAVFPRLRSGADGSASPRRIEALACGVPELDRMLSGGFERGTVTIITGPSGAGKTTLGVLFMKEAAARGERSVVYTFEEDPDTLLARCEAISIPMRSMAEGGFLSVQKVEPLEYSPDEFAQMVRFQVEQLKSRIVMIDSVAGYRTSLRGADLVGSLHAMCRYLASRGVTTLLVNEVETITGDFRATESGISYLADNILFLRYLEIDGELRKAVGVLKKRLSDFETAVHGLTITPFGVKVGEPIRFRGVLSGAPLLHDGGDT